VAPLFHDSKPFWGPKNFKKILPFSSRVSKFLPFPNLKSLSLIRDALPSRAEKMRELLQNLTGVPLSISPEPNAPAVTGGGGSGFLWWLLDCHGLLFNLSLIVPSTFFVAYLASQARNSFEKLTYGRSYIMISYYVLLWVASVLNLLWCFLQVRKPFLISHLSFVWN